MATKYPILQSGFVALNQNGITVPTEYSDLVISNVLSKDYRAPSNKYFYHPEIVKLYRHWMGDPNCLKDFDFRERLIRLAKEIFQTNNFFEWVDIQNRYANMTDLHQLFLMDTLKYLLGEPRTVEIPQWVALIEKSTKDESVIVDLKKFFRAGEMAQTVDYLPHTVKALITIWFHKPRGVEDLLITLFVIFGNRPCISDIAENPKKKSV